MHDLAVFPDRTDFWQGQDVLDPRKMTRLIFNDLRDHLSVERVWKKKKSIFCFKILKLSTSLIQDSERIFCENDSPLT